MKKLSIKKNSEIVQHCNFNNDEAMQAFIQLLADQAPWGKPERWVADAPMSPLSEEEKAKALESRSVEVMGEVLTEYKLAAEYEVEVEDISAQVEQERLNAEALSYLASTDWLVIRALDGGQPVPEDIRLLRAEARAKVVKL